MVPRGVLGRGRIAVGAGVADGQLDAGRRTESAQLVGRRGVGLVGRAEQLLGGGQIPLGSVTVDINAVNDAPAFAALGGAVGFTEDGAAVQLDGDATL